MKASKAATTESLSGFVKATERLQALETELRDCKLATFAMRSCFDKATGLNRTLEADLVLTKSITLDIRSQRDIAHKAIVALEEERNQLTDSSERATTQLRNENLEGQQKNLILKEELDVCMSQTTALRSNFFELSQESAALGTAPAVLFNEAKQAKSELLEFETTQAEDEKSIEFLRSTNLDLSQESATLGTATAELFSEADRVKTELREFKSTQEGKRKALEILQQENAMKAKEVAGLKKQLSRRSSWLSVVTGAVIGSILTAVVCGMAGKKDDDC